MTNVIDQEHILVVTNIYNIGNTLRERRKMLGYSGYYVSRMVGVATNTIYRGERGEWLPTLETLSAWAEVLGYETVVLRSSGYVSRRKHQ